MNRLEKCQLVKSLGYTYDLNTGKIYGVKGNEIKSTNRYIIITGNKKFKGNLLGHHFAWYMIYDNVDFEMLDHINGDKTDNRICNLRISNKYKNQWNRFDEIKGYSWSARDNKWKSTIKANGKSIFLGLYETEEEARQSYLLAKEKYHLI
jgi:hypothetical protein